MKCVTDRGPLFFGKLNIGNVIKVLQNEMVGALFKYVISRAVGGYMTAELSVMWFPALLGQTRTRGSAWALPFWRTLNICAFLGTKHKEIASGQEIWPVEQSKGTCG